MFCTNCGKENPDGSAFCSGCGKSFGAPVAQPVAEPVAEPVVEAKPVEAAQPVVPVAPVVQPTQPQPQPQAKPQVQPQPQPQAQQSSGGVSFGQHFKNLFTAAIHPVTGPASIAPQYSRAGNAIFLAGIVVVICSLVGGGTSLSIDLFNLAKLRSIYGAGSYVSAILKDIFFPILFYAVRVFGCAALMLLAGLIVKEKWSFPRLLAITAMSVGPAWCVNDLLGSYLGLIPYIRLGSLIATAAYLYCVVMLYEGYSAETKLTGNKKGFVIVAVLAIAGVVAGFFSF